MLSILAFILGSAIGSFVLVVASRYHVAPIINGRSKCLSCGEALRPSDLVPVFSYIFLKGKCRYCKSSYGVSALVVELLFGVVFLLLYRCILMGGNSLLLSTGELIYYTTLFGTLGVMALYDKAHSYIPTSFLSFFLLLTGGVYGVRVFEDPSIINFLSPFFVALPFLFLWLITKGKGLGFGDVILFFGVGMFFGTLQGLAVLIVSVWGGALVGLYIKYGRGDAVGKKHVAIPFVPFIALAFLVVLFTGIDALSIALLFS